MDTNISIQLVNMNVFLSHNAGALVAVGYH